jgi:hypothetical protein
MRTLPRPSDEAVRTLARYVGVSVLIYAAIGISFDLLGLRSAPLWTLVFFYVVVYVVDFLVTQAVVFQSASRGAFCRFIVATIGSIGLLSVMTSLVVEVDIPTVAVPVVASAIVFPVRFTVYRYWVYAERL